MSSTIVGRPMEILLVEDGLLDARVTIEALRSGAVQHRLTLVRDGDEAMQFLQNEGRFARAPRPDLVLLDLMLPKRNGLEVLELIRNTSNLEQVPVVVLTASDQADDRTKCEQYRVDSFIQKPVNLQKFLEIVRQLKRCWQTDIILPALD